MDRRLVNVRVAATIFEEVIRGHPMMRIETDWPDDATIVNAFWDHDRAEVVLTVHSSTFDELMEGMILPEWTPTITRQTDAASELLDLVRNGEARS